MAPAVITGRTRPTKPKKQMRAQKRKRADVDVEQLQQSVDELDAKADHTAFTDLPLSEMTQDGLKAAHFSTLTDIQAKAIPLALKGADILGAAKTGSGKTLAFLVPVLENLYRGHCVGAEAGLGAMIISPTRELAIQIFEVLRKVGGRGHMFAAGLVIGGKSLQEEQQALSRMNIVVCTPGRMLQHLSQTAMFSVDNLRMLVLDEADRILDMGFQRDVDAILEYLPRQRQTLLFSATQTKRVSDLARLSLKDPEYVSVHEAASTATPKTLQQNYVVTPLPEKLDTLWSFIQSSKKSKILVFLSSGKQVRFVYEAFRHLQPGIPLLHLHGRQRQTARLDITSKFSIAKHSCLFATDIVARGLDFPAVDWVVQVDCPEDADTYIHRVGRTARYEREGRAVLFLDPSEEEGMLQRLEQKKVPIERINIRQKKQQSIRDQLQNMCFKDPQLKYLGQKAFSSYAKSVYLQKEKDVFKINELPLEDFAASLGLPGAPRIKFLKGGNSKELKNAARQILSSDEEDEDEEEDGAQERGVDESRARKQESTVRTKYDRMFERRNQDVLTDHFTRMIRDDSESADFDPTASTGAANREGDGSEDDFLTVKQRIPAIKHPLSAEKSTAVAADDDDEHDGRKLIQLPGAKEPVLIDSKRREKLLQSKKKLLKLKDKGTRLRFDDEGNAHPLYELEDEDDFRRQGPAETLRERFVEEEKRRIEEADVRDKEVAKRKRKEKRERRKERERLEAGPGVEDDGGGLEDEDHSVELQGAGEDLLKNFLEDAEGLSDESVEKKPKKKPKKWFEDEDEDDISSKKKKKRTTQKKDPQTLEDLEALAEGLLGGN